MAYLKINGAASDVVSFAGGVLKVATGHGARFVHPVHGAPSPERPLLLQCGVRGADIASAYLECTGRDGDELTAALLSGTVVPGHVVAAGVDAAWWDEPPETIAGLVEAGDNVTVTGDGTAASPYVVAATGAGGGEPGPPGDAATVSVGTVATGAPGSSASVVNSGTSSAAVLDFAIPQGATGDQGIQGIQGPAGPEKRTTRYLWCLAGATAGTVGDVPGGVRVPWNCTINFIKAWAATNPTSAIGANVKAGGSIVHSSGLSIPVGSGGVDEKTVGFPASIAKNTLLTATTSALPADATWVFVEIELREV